MSVNRLTNCDKWNDQWFSDLSPEAKLLFMFLCENCDNAGVYEVNKKFMMFLTGLNEMQLARAIPEIKSKYIRSKDGSKIWMTNFLKHQKKLPLNRNNNAHRQIIMILEANVQYEEHFQTCKKMTALIPPDPSAPRKRHTPKSNMVKMVKPTRVEIFDLMVSLGFANADTEATIFFNYFESNGWKVGKNPMKDWNAAVHGWVTRWYERNDVKKPKGKLANIEASHQESLEIDWNEVYK